LEAKSDPQAEIKMKVLHVTDADLPGRRFSGYDLLDDLTSRGVDSKQAVLNKFSRNSNVISLLADRGDEELQARLIKVESHHSINNLLFPWGRVLADLSEFRDADVIHYHLIHNHVLSLYDLPWLVSLKPSIWTFHDPWVVTGHCVHPMGCPGWLEGCSPCPYLDRHFPLREDRADQMWRLKRSLLADLDVDVVVASTWMLDIVNRSPLTSHLERVHLIPFGVDAATLQHPGTKRESRHRLGIPEDDFVVLLRAHNWDAKGLQFAAQALRLRAPARPTTLLTVDRTGLVQDLRRTYRVVELGWVNDDATYAMAFAACDVFLMPSIAESFGLMAVEAMAAGRPVVCFEGTALPGVTHAPECGVAVPQDDALALREAIDDLAQDPREAQRRGSLGQQIVAREYEHGRYLDALTALYGSAQQRRQTPSLS
jgi:glycosyltransferase involved in cell wall biosynthesis